MILARVILEMFIFTITEQIVIQQYFMLNQIDDVIDFEDVRFDFEDVWLIIKVLANEDSGGGMLIEDSSLLLSNGSLAEIKVIQYYKYQDVTIVLKLVELQVKW